MDLRVIWFILVSILFVGFFFLEGFDFGVGILLNLIGKKDEEKREIINSIGPFWDGNEVWLITAGGVIFAAFPRWYATMFSGFYLALLVMLAALILRVVYFEFRSKKESSVWKRNWDRIMFICSLILAILWGTALANLIKGIPIDKSLNFTGSFFDLISIYTLFAGITTLLVFVFHGALYLSLKTGGEVEQRAKSTAKELGVFTMASLIILAVLTFIQTDLYESRVSLAAALLAIIFEGLGWYLIVKNSSVKAFISSGLSIALGVASLFLGLFPRVIVSSISPEFNLTIYNASSSAYTLSLMTKVALIFVPIVLAYQVWTYWIFRKRVSKKDLKY